MELSSFINSPGGYVNGRKYWALFCCSQRMRDNQCSLSPLLLRSKRITYDLNRRDVLKSILQAELKLHMPIGFVI